eukprot:1161478-Pelagomonas_calceolata.AAC.1
MPSNSSTRHTLEKASLDFHHQDQARATASRPLIPVDLFLLFLLVKGIHGALALGIFFSLFDVRSVCTACGVPLLFLFKDMQKSFRENTWGRKGKG